MLIYASEHISLLVGPESYTYVHLLMTEKKKAVELLYLHEVQFPAFSFIVGDGYL